MCVRVERAVPPQAWSRACLPMAYRWMVQRREACRIHDVSIFAAAGLHRMMAWFSGARRVASILSVFVVIFSVLALQTATHVAKIDNLCAVEVSQVDSEQVAHHPLDGGADPAVLGRVIALMPKPVSAIASIMSDEGAILRPCVLGIPTTGPPASHI